MTKRHDELFTAVLSGVPKERERVDRGGGARFLKRGNAISARVAGDKEEKVLNWVDPARCRMWTEHNRNYGLLTEENCRDLIDGLRAQGKQEFPAIVRRLQDPDYDYEVICGARRHFSVSWLRANNYPDFKFLVEERELTDEEAFRLADIENRDRKDISDYERAKDYARAIELYYGGKQKSMAERLEVSPVWLSRFLEMAKLPSVIVTAFASPNDIRELHARSLKPLLKDRKSRDKVLAVAKELSQKQDDAREGQGTFVDGASVIAQLKASAKAPKPHKETVEYAGQGGSGKITHTRERKQHRLEFPANMSRSDLQEAFAAFMDAEF